MVKRLMSAYVEEELNNKRRSKGLSWEAVIKRGLEDMDNSLEMNRRFELLFETKVKPQIREMQKRLYDVEKENEELIDRIIKLKEGRDIN